MERLFRNTVGPSTGTNGRVILPGYHRIVLGQADSSGSYIMLCLARSWCVAGARTTVTGRARGHLIRRSGRDPDVPFLADNFALVLTALTDVLWNSSTPTIACGVLVTRSASQEARDAEPATAFAGLGA